MTTYFVVNGEQYVMGLGSFITDESIRLVKSGQWHDFDLFDVGGEDHILVESPKYLSHLFEFALDCKRVFHTVTLTLTDEVNVDGKPFKNQLACCGRNGNLTLEIKYATKSFK